MENYDYATALQYYLLHGTNRALKRLFQSGEDAYTRERLREEVEKLQQASIYVPPTPQKVRDAPKEQTISGEVIDFYLLPEAVQKMIVERNALRKERDFYFAQLLHYAKDEDRAQALGRVLKCDKDSTAIQSDIDHFFKFKVVKKYEEMPEMQLTDRADLMRRKHTLVANISRDKRLGKLYKLEKWQTELEKINQQLNSDAF